MKIRKKEKFKSKKRKFRAIISTFLCLALLGGAVFGISKLLKNDSDTVEIKNSAFAVGGLDEEGKYVENKQTLYTKEMFRCDGLTVELDKDCSSTYQIFFYNYFGEFLTSTAVLSEDFDEELETGSVYAKIVVIPEIPEGEKVADFKISFFEKAKYLDGVSITVDNDQDDGNLIGEIDDGVIYELSEDESSIVSLENADYSSYFMSSVSLDLYVKNVGADTIYITKTGDGVGTYSIVSLEPGESSSFAVTSRYSGKDYAVWFKTGDKLPVLYFQ